MTVDTVLTPKVIAGDILSLGYITANPAYPNLQPFKPSPAVLESLKNLKAKSEPVENSGLHWGIAKRGWLSLQLSRFLGIRGHVTARTALVVQGGEIEHQTFNDNTTAFETVFSDRETQSWINKVSTTTKKVYFVVAIDRISSAQVTQAMVKSSGAEAFADVPLEQLGARSIELKGGFSFEDFGISSVKNVTGIFAVAYHEVQLKPGVDPKMRPTVTWVRPPTIVMGRAGEETEMAVSLGECVGLKTLSKMMEVEMEQDEEDESE